jgi:acyl-CoA synthetase (AMP-forming)/AMP-acid ligase II
LSETFTVVTDTPSRAPSEVRDGTNGRPLSGMEVRIVDEKGHAVGVGQEGEIVVRGVTLMRGYYKGGAGVDSEGFFHTCDSGFLDRDGYLHWTGRLSNLIKTGGANVSPLEVERALAGCPGVRSAAAVGVPHPTLGEVVIACAVKSGDVDDELVRAWLRERIASYKVPRRVLFIDALPFGGTEKVQLAELRRIALEVLRAQKIEIDGHRYWE